MRKCQTEEERLKRRKEVQRKATKRYYERNREKLIAKQKEYRSTDEFKERHRLEMIEWRKSNPEKQLEISRRSYKKNGSKQNEKKRLRYKNDQEYVSKIKERESKYKESGRRAEVFKIRYKEKRDEIIQKSAQWKQKNKDHVRKYARQYRDNIWLEHERNQRKNLADQYIIAVIKKETNYILKTKDIPQQLIEIKRLQLKTKRSLKN